MLSFTNVTTLETYANVKKYRNITFESVPNTAAGCDNKRKIFHLGNFDYIVGCNTEKDFWLSFNDGTNDLFILFSIVGDNVTINKASNNKRHETAERNLKKYMQLVTTIASCIKYDRAVFW